MWNEISFMHYFGVNRTGYSERTTVNYDIISCVRCRELMALLHLTCDAVSDETDWTTTNGTLLLDAVQRLVDAKKPALTPAEQISV